MADLNAQGSSTEEQLSLVQQERAQHDQSLSEGLLSALEDSKAQLAEYRKKVRNLSKQLEQESEARRTAEAEAHRMQDRNTLLRATLNDQLKQSEMLNTKSQTVDFQRQILAAIAEAETARSERDVAIDKADHLEKALAAATSEEVAHLSMHEASVREEIRDLNEQRTKAMKGQIQDLESDRDRLESEVTQLVLKLENAEKTIDSISRSHGTSTARQEDMQRERDAALAQIKLLKQQVQDSRIHTTQTQQGLRSESPVSHASSRYVICPAQYLQLYCRFLVAMVLVTSKRD